MANKEKREKNFLSKYFLRKYLYSGEQSVLNEAEKIIDLEQWSRWHCVMMIESTNEFFDTVEETIAEEIYRELHRTFFYVNLNAYQSLLLFQDVYCDYHLLADHIYTFLKRNYTERFYLAVSQKFDGLECLPEILEQLERQMEGEFYYPEVHVFFNEEESLQLAGKEVQDSQLIKMISEDILRKDVEQLWRHFDCLSKKYQWHTQYSAMYIKFVFSKVIQELYQEDVFMETRSLEKELERLYNGKHISEILKITAENIWAYERGVFHCRTECKNDVEMVKEYIIWNAGAKLSEKLFSDNRNSSYGYLNFIFRKETGMNMKHFIHVQRLEKSRKLLCETDMNLTEISERAGFLCVAYFYRSFQEYYGISPEMCGNTE